MGRVFDIYPSKGYKAFGYLNKKGEITIDLIYRKAFDFVSGYALVQDEDLNWWLINRKGQRVKGPCLGLIENNGKWYAS